MGCELIDESLNGTLVLPANWHHPQHPAVAEAGSRGLPHLLCMPSAVFSTGIGFRACCSILISVVRVQIRV